MKSLPITGLLAGTIFLSGAAFAAMTPYRAIVGIETLGLSNSGFGLVMALNAVGSALAAVALGWLSDRVQDRRLLVLFCAVMGVISFALVWAFQTPLVFVTAFCLLIPFGNSLFSQSFSYSRVYFDREEPKRAEFILSLLRSMFSMAWIVTPPVAGWIAAQSSAYAVFGFSMLAYVGCTLTVGLLMTQPKARIGRGKLAVPAESGAEPSTEAPARLRISTAHRFGLAGVTLALAALQLNMVLLPLVIVRDLAGTYADVGTVAAVAAAIEVPLMIGWGYLAMRMRKDSILAIASAAFALYFGLMVFADQFLHVLALQAIAALAIAALLSINISYLQEAIPGRMGLSTSLVDMTRVVSVWTAAAIFALNSGQTYTPMMAVAAALSLGGAGFMLLARSAGRRAQVASEHFRHH